MTDDIERPARLGGFRALLVGGGLIALLLVYLDPVTRVEDCPNYGGNGNASAFADAGWDGYLPLLMIFWISAVVVEQALPYTWRGRGRVAGAARVTAAVVLSLFAACFVTLPLEVVCH